MNFFTDVLYGWKDIAPPGSTSHGISFYELTRGIALGEWLRKTLGSLFCHCSWHEPQELWGPKNSFRTSIVPLYCRRCRTLMAWASVSSKRIIQPSTADIADFGKAYAEAKRQYQVTRKAWRERPLCGFARDGYSPCTRDHGHDGDHGYEVEPGLIFAPFP